MKYVNKTFEIFLIILMCIPSIFYAPPVEAKTIADLRKELDEILEKEKDNNNKITLNENEITAIENEVGAIYTEIENANRTIKEKEEEIKTLEIEIKEKDESSKKLMASLQTTSGNSFYIEYLFGADSITDFIYRFAMTEQITTYNEKLIKEMNDKIEEAKKLSKELEDKQKELKEKQVSLTAKLGVLEASNDKLYELGMSIEEEIKAAKKVIQTYIDAGCKENEDINICANRVLPPDTQFYRPFEHGGVSSEYGYRSAVYDSNGKLVAGAMMHEGIDLTNGLGTKNPIYSVANGVVKYAKYDYWSGNTIVIHHNINGKTYSSTYQHLSRMLVDVGDIVTKDTIIGYMGSTGIYSSGYHLHLAISTGLRYTDYSGLSAYVARTINPRSVINFPSHGSWSDRIHYYN